jgi:hypothetical protein
MASADTVVAQLNRVQYIAEDFATYRSEANNFYQTYYPEDFNNLINTDLGNAVMDQLAFAMQALSFKANRTASELFLATARLNSSIVKLARMLGYAISPGAPGSTDLTIVFPGAPYSFPIPIQPGMQFSGPGSIIYEYANLVPLILPAGMTTMTIPLREGQTQTILFTSDGTTNQAFNIYGIASGQFLYNDNFTVSIDGTLWERLALLQYESTNIYEVQFVASPPQLLFGDGITGNVPAAGSSISVTYRSGQGKSGTIGQNQISGPVNPLVVNGIEIPMTLTNTTGDSGEDPEDINHVKIYASSFFRTQNAAVVKSDYNTIAQLQPGVALADAQIIRGIDNDITIQSCLSGIASGTSEISTAISGLFGVGGLYVGGTSSLGVSGTSYLGWNGSSVTGTQFLGVSGESLLYVGGTSGLEVIANDCISGVNLINSYADELADYLSQAFSDTSQANQVQVVVLGVDSNNAYISPSLTVLENVQTTLQSICDAVVTVVAVDGSSKIVPCGVSVELGISETAVQANVENNGLQALIQTTSPYGLLVLRSAGTNLYKSNIQDAIEAANQAGDILYLNINITFPSDLLDSNGNLIISAQQIIQNLSGAVSVNAVQRFVNGVWINI